MQEFKELIQPYTLKEAQEEAARCYNCKHFPCHTNCPTGVPIPEFIAEVKNGNIKRAYEIISTASNLPAITSRSCPHEIQCQGNCVRCKVDGNVNIGRLERFVADTMLDEYRKDNFKALSVDNIPPKTVKVAIVGSGPCGLSAAMELAKNGISATVFERDSLAGGVLINGLPSFRLPKDIVLRQIELVKSMGVKFECNTAIGVDRTVEELKNEFDYIILAIGVTSPIAMGMDGENIENVMQAYDYLKFAKLGNNTDNLIGDSVAVLGAGNVAMDVARTAKRLGSKRVTIIYRRTRDEMPARLVELEEAEHEGVEFVLLTNPTKVIATNGVVSGLNCIKMQLGEKDASGRPRPEPIKGSDFVIECDKIILALGGKQDETLLAKFGLGVNKGKIEVSDSMKTIVDNIYAGGDVVTGALTVVKAMVAGAKAAKGIIECL